jgi:NhaA family Na+:H+ antiporter
MALVVAGICLLVLAYLNYRQVMAKSMYLFVGLIMWIGLLKSGVHATLAGVMLAIFIPIKSKDNPAESPLKELEHDLHSAVAFFILPIFAFFNAGLNLSGVGLEQITHSVPLGIILGLVVGKQLGIFGLCWLGVKLKWAELPKGMDLGSLYGVAALCGIGFTMSLFIGSLAFEETGVNLLFDERLGILIGSIVSGIIGFLVLNKTLSKQSG